MTEPYFETPVAFLIFNRPDSTQRVFDTIRALRPKKLLLIADGPRADKKGEDELCARTRKVVGGIDWNCEVLKNFSAVNMGCKKRVSSGLTWAFEQVDRLVILEDDCLPSPSFFHFCAEMLETYADDERIGMISGDHFVPQTQLSAQTSYRFSIYGHIWGWASWRRAWRNYDVDMRLWPEVRASRFLEHLGDNSFQRYWTRIFDLVARGKIDTWDYQWVFAMWMQRQLTILPNKNLILNLGFGPDATHTVEKPPKWVPQHYEDIEAELLHPAGCYPDTAADRWAKDNIFRSPSIWQRLSRVTLACLGQ